MERFSNLKTMGDDLQQLNKIARRSNWILQWDLEDRLLRQNKVILVTDIRQQIVFATQNIVLLNGYSKDEVIGNTPRMFQGADTDPARTAIIRNALKNHKCFHEPVLNYKKNGDVYYCDIQGFPVLNKQRKVEHFIAFETLLHQAV